MDIPLAGEPVDGAEPQPEDDRLWSVTAIIGCLDKPALVAWAALETAKAAVDDRTVWQSRLENEGYDSAIDYLKSARFARKGKRSATALGTLVHDACETYALTGSRPVVDDEVRPFLDQFDRFLGDWQPEFEAVETTVFHPELGYAGTADAFVRLDGERVILDYKSSRESTDSQGRRKSPYSEVALQLAAYRHAQCAAVWRARRFERYRRRYYLLSPEERGLAVPVPEVAGGVAVGLYPDRYAVHPVRCDERVFDAFLHIQEAARWSFELARRAIGAAMNPPERPVAMDSGDPFDLLPAGG